MFRFASLHFLIGLLVVPAAFFYRSRRRRYSSLHVSGIASLEGMDGSFFVKIGRFVPLLKYITLCLMIIALARPQYGIKDFKISTPGINIILAVDLSQSMAAMDFNQNGSMVTRLQAVKGVIHNFIAKRHGDRIGMVVFASQAYTQLPLPPAYNSITSILARLQIGSAGDNTAIGDAIGISLKRLQDIKSASHVIILLTDGVSNSGGLTPEMATDIAVQRHVKIYTVGVGRKGDAPFLVHDPLFGDQYIYKQVDIDEQALKNIAEKTGGLYFRASDTRGLDQIYATINRLEKTEVKLNTYGNFEELYAYFLIPATLLLGLWTVLTNTRFLRVP